MSFLIFCTRPLSHCPVKFLRHHHVFLVDLVMIKF